MIPYSSLYGTKKILSFYKGVVSVQYPYMVCDAFWSFSSTSCSYIYIYIYIWSESFYVNSEIDIWYDIWYKEKILKVFTRVLLQGRILTRCVMVLIL